MTDDRFPLGKPIRAPEPKHCPERKRVRTGIFEVDGKLQTDLPVNGPQFAPVPDLPITTEQWDKMVTDAGMVFLGGFIYRDRCEPVRISDPAFPIEFWGTF